MENNKYLLDMSDVVIHYETDEGIVEAVNGIDIKLAEGKTMPVVVGADGKVIMKSNGQPQRMVYNYNEGSATYSFQGGDAIYEDVNHDGQINALDIVYLGNSLPKLSGGFNFNITYGRWGLRARFM